MASEEERERATVYMEGMAQMRRDWSPKGSQKSEVRSQKEKGKAKGKGRKRETLVPSPQPLVLPRLIRDDLLARRDAQRLRHVAIDRELGEIFRS